MGSQSSDEQLVELAALGKAGAFDLLVERHQERVFNVLLRMCGSEAEAEELAQETFFRAWRGLKSFRKGSRFFTWVYRIALNAVFTQRRDRQRRQRHEAGSLDAPVNGVDGDRGETTARSLLPDTKVESDPVRCAEKAELRDSVQKGLLQLDEDYRRVVILRDLDGMDYESIAEALEISQAAVKSRLHRARRELARVLKDLQP